MPYLWKKDKYFFKIFIDCLCYSIIAFEQIKKEESICYSKLLTDIQVLGKLIAVSLHLQILYL